MPAEGFARPIRDVPPLDGIPYLAGYQAAGNNPVIFAFAEGKDSPRNKLCIAAESSRRIVDVADIERAIAAYRQLLRRHGYRVGNGAGRYRDSDRGATDSIDEGKGIDQIPIGKAFVYYSGYASSQDSPLILCSPCSRRGSVGRGRTPLSPRSLDQELRYCDSNVSFAGRIRAIQIAGDRFSKLTQNATARWLFTSSLAGCLRHADDCGDALIHDLIRPH